MIRKKKKINNNNIYEIKKIMRDPDTNQSRGFGFVNFDCFEASDAAIDALNGQYLCNRPITVSYAIKKGTKGERHGSEAERLLAAKNPRLQNRQRPNLIFAPFPPTMAVPPPMGGMPPMMGMPPGMPPPGMPPPGMPPMMMMPPGMPPPGMPPPGMMGMPPGMPPHGMMGMPPPGMMGMPPSGMMGMPPGMPPPGMPPPGMPHGASM